MRWTFAVAVTTLGAALACGGGEEEKAETKADTKTETKAEAKPAEKKPEEKKDPTFDDAAFTCCGDDMATKMIEEYLDLQRVLTGGDPKRGDVSAAAYALEAHAKGMSNEDVTHKSKDIARDIRDLISPVKDSDVANVKKALPGISKKAIEFAKQNEGGEKKIAIAHCESSDTWWIQEGASISNPSGEDCGRFIPRAEAK